MRVKSLLPSCPVVIRLLDSSLHQLSDHLNDSHLPLDKGHQGIRRMSLWRCYSGAWHQYSGRKKGDIQNLEEHLE